LSAIHGCTPIEKEAVKAQVQAEVDSYIASPRFDARVADSVSQIVKFRVDKSLEQKTDIGGQTGRINIGAISVNDSGYIVGIALFLVSVWLWRRCRKATKTVDMLVKHNEELEITPDERKAIRIMALAKGVEKFLNKRVHKVRKKRSDK